MSGSRAGRLDGLKARIAALEAGTRTLGAVLPFGDARVDGCLPGGGLGLGRWHEFVGEGLEAENAASTAAFVAALARPLAAKGQVVWVVRRDDLFAPGLEGLGLPAERVIGVCARDEAEALMVLEDALGTPGVAAAVGEVEAVDLTAGRRLQLACERQGATGLVIRRRPFGGAVRRETGSAAASRWKVSAALSEPAPGEPGLGPPRWRVELERARGGRAGGWIMEHEASHDAHPFRVVTGLADLGLAPEEPLRLRA
ncbi:MAG: ImuA family protein [Ignavibacteriales bacterium]